MASSGTDRSKLEKNLHSADALSQKLFYNIIGSSSNLCNRRLIVLSFFRRSLQLKFRFFFLGTVYRSTFKSTTRTVVLPLDSHGLSSRYKRVLERLKPHLHAADADATQLDS